MCGWQSAPQQAIKAFWYVPRVHGCRNRFIVYDRVQRRSHATGAACGLRLRCAALPARELVLRLEYGRLAIAVATNRSITLERNILGEIGSI